MGSERGVYFGVLSVLQIRNMSPLVTRKHCHRGGGLPTLYELDAGSTSLVRTWIFRYSRRWIVGWWARPDLLYTRHTDGPNVSYYWDSAMAFPRLASVPVDVLRIRALSKYRFVPRLPQHVSDPLGNSGSMGFGLAACVSSLLWSCHCGFDNLPMAHTRWECVGGVAILWCHSSGGDLRCSPRFPEVPSPREQVGNVWSTEGQSSV